MRLTVPWSVSQSDKAEEHTYDKYLNDFWGLYRLTSKLPVTELLLKTKTTSNSSEAEIVYI